MQDRNDVIFGGFVQFLFLTDRFQVPYDSNRRMPP